MEIAQKLWKEENEMQKSRFAGYREITNSIIDEIFYRKGFITTKPTSLKSCSFLKEIGKSYYMANKQPYYDQSECAKFVCDELKKQGFFAKTVNHCTSIFISWHPSHLDLISNDKKKREENRRNKLILDQKLQYDQYKKSEQDETDIKNEHQPMIVNNFAENQKIDSTSNKNQKKKKAAYIDLHSYDTDLNNRLRLTDFFISQKYNR